MAQIDDSRKYLYKCLYNTTAARDVYNTQYITGTLRVSVMISHPCVTAFNHGVLQVDFDMRRNRKEKGIRTQVLLTIQFNFCGH